MHRLERPAFTVEEALDLLQNRNMQGKENRYLDRFVKFVRNIESIKVEAD